MAKVVKHIALTGGCACLLDNGMVEVLGVLDHLKDLADSLAYIDNVVDISNVRKCTDEDSFIEVYYTLYWTLDGKTWRGETGNTYTCTGAVHDYHHRLSVIHPELVCTPNAEGVWVTKEGYLLPKLPRGENPSKVLQTNYAIGSCYLWGCLTKSGKFFQQAPISSTSDRVHWVEPLGKTKNKVTDMFYVDGGVVLLLDNGKLFSTTRDIPEYLEGVKQKI